MATRNPFTPSFGTVPTCLAGRQDILDDMRWAFADGYGNPNLSTIFIGARATGKTALMSCVRDEALAQGWVAASSTALPGMLEDIYEQALISSQHLMEKPAVRQLTSISVGPVSAGWEQGETPMQGNWRSRMSLLLDRLSEHDTGLLITVDEVRADCDELIQLVAVYQHFVTERRRVSLVMAGLPYQVHRLISDKSVSFLRRSSQRSLGRIPSADVALALRKTIQVGGKQVEDEAVSLCVNAIDGFAYMLQLVGYRMWLEAGDEKNLTVLHALRGIAGAKRDMEEHILASTYRELSPVDVRFVEAMADDAHESRLSDIAARMGVTNGYASKYKARLLASGVIGERGRGVVAFDIPGLREYVLSRTGEE